MDNQFTQFNLKPEIITALDEMHFTNQRRFNAV